MLMSTTLKAVLTASSKLFANVSPKNVAQKILEGNENFIQLKKLVEELKTEDFKLVVPSKEEDERYWMELGILPDLIQAKVFSMD
jgi:hypothetical protein